MDYFVRRSMPFLVFREVCSHCVRKARQGSRVCKPLTRLLFFFDLLRLSRPVSQIYPAPWNAVKIAYLFCRYFPLVVSPFLFWGFVGNHTESVCRLYYHALYACIMPTVRPVMPLVGYSRNLISLFRCYQHSVGPHPRSCVHT